MTGNDKVLIKGNYAIALFTSDDDQKLYVMKKGSPLVIGEGKGFNLVASDASPMIGFTNDFIELDDYEFGILSNDKIKVVIGPEGGITTSEVELLENKGFIKVTLGKRILRSETASFNILSVLAYILELER